MSVLLLASSLLLVSGWATAARAQQKEIETAADAGLDPDVDTSRTGNRIIVPVPMGDPELGAGLALAAVWFYQPSGSVRPWTTGIGAFRTSNESWGLGAAQMMSLDRDKFRLELYGGHGKINQRYYGSAGRSSGEDSWVEVGEKTSLISAKARVRLAESFFLGLRARFLNKESRVRETSGLPPGFDESVFQSDLTLVEAGPVVTYDDTEDAFAPREGSILNGQWLFAIPALGSTIEYDKATVSARHYVPIGESNSIALQVQGCAASDTAPFFDICPVGLRGYSNGRFRDRASWSAEVEWRQKLSRKFGAVLFAGAGSTGSDFSDAASSKLLPAVGVGIRYLVAESYGVNLRTDGAIGRDSKAVYVSIGESF